MPSLLLSKRIFPVEAPFRLVRVDHNVSMPVEVIDYDIVGEEVWVVFVVIASIAVVSDCVAGFACHGLRGEICRRIDGKGAVVVWSVIV
jgi:hypothetical protein